MLVIAAGRTAARIWGSFSASLMSVNSTTTTDGANNRAGLPVRIYHNPQCVRSREALEYLRQQRVQLEVVEYLKNPLTAEQLRQLIRMLGIAPSSLIRANDFKRLGLAPTNDYEKLIQLIAQHPVLMERPIVVCGSEARIGRPLENLHDLFGGATLRRKP
jgi:arsenate reductase